MSTEGLPKYEEYIPKTYSEKELTEDQFVHPDDSEYPNVKQEDRNKSKKYEVFHDGIIESLRTDEEYETTITRLEQEGYDIKKSASIGI